MRLQLLDSKKMNDLLFFHRQQINTADMLDLAVGYIKDLQKQVQVMKQIHHFGSRKLGFKHENSHQPHLPSSYFLINGFVFFCAESQ